MNPMRLYFLRREYTTVYVYLCTQLLRKNKLIKIESINKKLNKDKTYICKQKKN